MGRMLRSLTPSDEGCAYSLEAVNVHTTIAGAENLLHLGIHPSRCQKPHRSSNFDRLRQLRCEIVGSTSMQAKERIERL